MRPFNKFIFSLFISMASLLGGGCALVDNEVDLQYTVLERSPLQDIPPLRLEINVVDGRPERERERVGEVRNGYGSHLSDVLSKEPVTQELRQALAKQFQAAGHQVVTRNPQVRINMRLEKIDVATVVNFWDVEIIGQINTTISTYNPPSVAKPVTLPLNGSAMLSEQVAHETAREQALNQALAEMMRSLIFNETFLNSLRQAGSTVNRAG